MKFYKLKDIMKKLKQELKKSEKNYNQKMEEY